MYKNVCNFPTNLMKLHSIELYNIITAKKKKKWKYIIGHTHL